MVKDMKENLRRIKRMEKVFYKLMDINMKVNSKMIKGMEMVYKLILMVIDMRESLGMV